MNGPSYDPATHTAHYEGRSAAVTAKEGAAFAYLAERLGQIVSREELERDVWEMAPGVRSQTVPVTMRNLRRKLTWGDFAAIETVRGVGYRLKLPSRPQRLAPLPDFATPYEPRPHEETSLRGLVEGGWRVVTVVGPTGAGKSRLAVAVARASGQRFAFCELSDDPGGVEHDLLRAVGLQSRDLADIEQLGEDLWILVDGVGRSDEVLAEVVRLVGQVTGLRFLLTSWRPVQVAGEAVHAIAPMGGAQGRRFLEGRLAAAPWRHRAEQATLDRAVELLDGLPLGLELLAAHPEPLEKLVEGLEAGEIPNGPEGETLEHLLAATYQRLNPEAARILTSLSACEGALTLAQIADWLGPSAAQQVRELAARSIVLPQGAGWRMRHAMRNHLWALAGPRRSELRLAFASWLATRVEVWRQRWFEDPAATWVEVEPLLGDVYGLFGTLEPQQLPRLAWWLLQVFETRGPRIGVRRMLRAIETRLGPQLLPVYLRAIHQGSVGTPPPPDADAPPYLQLLYLTLVSDYDPEAFDPERIEALHALGDPVLSHRIAMLLSSRPGAEHDTEEQLRQAIADTQQQPPLQIESCRRLARFMAPARTDEAIHYVRYAVQLAGLHQLPILRFRCHWVLASVLSEVDPRLSAEAAIEGADEVRAQAPREADALAGTAGLFLFGLGEDERAAPLLEAASHYPSKVVAAGTGAAFAAIGLRRDAPDADPRPIRAFDPRSMLLYRFDGSSASEAFKRFLVIEFELHEARQRGEELAVLEACVAECEEAAHPDDPSLLRVCLQSLRRRLDEARALS